MKQRRVWPVGVVFVVVAFVVVAGLAVFVGRGYLTSKGGGEEPPGEVVIGDRVGARAGDPVPGSAPLGVRGAESAGARVELPSIEGRVVSPQGEPVGDGRVFARVAASEGTDGEFFARSDADGRFRLDGLPAEPVLLWASAPSGEWPDTAVQQVVPGETDVLLRFPENPRVFVSVIDARDGAPLDAFRIVVRGLHAGEVRSLETLILQAGGRGGLPVSVPGAVFTLEAQALGYEPKRLGPYDRAESPAQVEFRLHRRAGFGGRVLSMGSPVPGARVELFEVSPEDIRYVCDGFPSLVDCEPALSIRADEEGYFFVQVTGSEAVHLAVQADGLAPAWLGPFSPEQMEAGPFIEVHMTEGGALRIALRSTGGELPSGSVVAISNGNGRRLVAPIGENHTVRFDRLTPGPWMVRRLDDHDPSGSSRAALRVLPELKRNPPVDCFVYEGEVTEFELWGD